MDPTSGSEKGAWTRRAAVRRAHLCKPCGFAARSPRGAAPADGVPPVLAARGRRRALQPSRTLPGHPARLDRAGVPGRVCTRCRARARSAAAALARLLPRRWRPLRRSTARPLGLPHRPSWHASCGRWSAPAPAPARLPRRATPQLSPRLLGSAQPCRALPRASPASRLARPPRLRKSARRWAVPCQEAWQGSPGERGRCGGLKRAGSSPARAGCGPHHPP